MFKSLIEKRHAKPQIGLEEGVQVAVLGLNRPVLMSIGAVPLLPGLPGR